MWAWELLIIRALLQGASAVPRMWASVLQLLVHIVLYLHRVGLEPAAFDSHKPSPSTWCKEDTPSYKCDVGAFITEITTNVIILPQSPPKPNPAVSAWPRLWQYDKGPVRKEENRLPRTLWKVAGSATYELSKTEWNCVVFWQFVYSVLISHWKKEFVYLACLGVKMKSVSEDRSVLIKIYSQELHSAPLTCTIGGVTFKM